MQDKNLLIQLYTQRNETNSELQVSSSARKEKKKREKSLGQLCLQFIELFVNKHPEISLEQAGLMLSSAISFDYHKIKTKIRRLYDIANVLQALNLIEKILLHNNKPGFKWLGYNGFLSFLKHQQTKNNQSESTKGSDKKVKIFAISREPFVQATKVVPRIKHFKPKVLQLGSPFLHKEMMNTSCEFLSAKSLKFTKKRKIDEFSIEIAKESRNLSLLLEAMYKV
jgi:hypothetical protein